MRELWPITTPGTPEKVKPATLYSHSQCRPIWYQMPGMVGLRCGSLASSRLPVAVLHPAMTQELHPIPGAPSPIRLGSLARSAATESNVEAASWRYDAGAARAAASVKAPSLTVPPLTMVRLRSNGYAG